MGYDICDSNYIGAIFVDILRVKSKSVEGNATDGFIITLTLKRYDVDGNEKTLVYTKEFQKTYNIGDNKTELVDSFVTDMKDFNDSYNLNISRLKELASVVESKLDKE